MHELRHQPERTTTAFRWMAGRKSVLTNVIQTPTLNLVDIRFELNGLLFAWDEDKALRNRRKHRIAFEEAVEVFFDPFFRLVDASRHEEARDAVIGRDTLGRALHVVHIEFEGEFIRIISARKATGEELKHHDS